MPKNDPNPYPIFSKITIPLSKNSSILGILSHNFPIAYIRPPIAIIRADNERTPINAAGPPKPTTVNIKHAAESDKSNKDSDLAMPIVDSTGRSLSKYNMPANAAITNVITPTVTNAIGDTPPIYLRASIEPVKAISNNVKPDAADKLDSIDISRNKYNIPASAAIIAVIIMTEPIALLDMLPNLPIIAIDPAIDNKTVDSAPAAPRVDSTGKPARIYKAVPIKPIAAVITISAPKDLLTFSEALIINANIPITVAIAPVATAILEGSMKESAIIASAITPIAAVIAIKMPLTCLAFLLDIVLVANIIPVIIPPRMVTAITPLANDAISINPRSIATNANIAIAPDRARRVVAIFGASFPANLVIRTNKAITPTNPSNPAAAFPISAHFIFDIILATIVNAKIAPDIDNNVIPTVSKFFPGIIVISISNVIMPTSPNKPAPALAMSPQDILAIDLATIVNIKIAADIFSNVGPTLFMFLPAILVIRTNRAIIPTKPRRPAPALAISPQDIFDIIFATIVNISIAPAILNNITPALSAFWADFPFTNFP